jgi:transcriptional regulator
MPDRRDFLLGLSLLGLESEASAADTIYIPERQSEKDRALLLDFLEEFSFAMLITAKDGIRVSNVPTLAERSEEGWGKIWWHLAKSNAQNEALDGSQECVAVFRGPHAYISPNWYNTKNAVPTWNFATVHCTGKPRRLDDDAAFARSLERLVAKNEGLYGGGSNWDFSKLPDSYLKGMRQGIVAYEMTIERVEGKFKLGQERSAADRQGVIAGLAQGPKERSILDLTREYYARLKG